MEQKKILNEDETRVFLEGMGFEADENKTGLYKKNLSDGSNAFWDFRKNKNGSFYITHAFDDGGEFWKDKEAKQTTDYIEVRKVLGGEVKEKKIEKQDQQKQENSLSVLESKSQAFDIMNQRDDSQVLLEIQGGFMEEFVYSFPTKEGKVTGLSWAGAKEVARQMGNISVEDCDILEKPDTYLVKCKAKDMTRNVTMFGVAEQSKSMRLKSGDSIPDLHALSKAVSRAQRNAIRGLIPELFIKKMIEQYLKGE